MEQYITFIPAISKNVHMACSHNVPVGIFTMNDSQTPIY